MADDTGTDWAATATEIEGFSCTNWECDHHECKFLRAAAVGLRRLAQLDAAIGERQQLRAWLDEHNTIMLRQVIAAVLRSGEQPEGPTTCPTCGSRSPMYAVRTPDNPWGDCADSWHGGRR